ncbi:MAG: hypothetical protein MUF79_10795 [Burkholderiales bacterium]|jgi:hypothetical protein|nr:hypothetical protein [Burkholderiales bacterium]
MRSCRKLAPAIALAILCSGTAAAAVSGIAAGGVVFLSGGIGETERQEMLTREPEFDLTIWTALKGSCAFVVPERLWITDAKGKAVFEMEPEGPITYLHLGPGRFSVNAMYSGVTVTQPVTIPAVGRRNVFFYWTSAAEVGPTRANPR